MSGHDFLSYNENNHLGAHVEPLDFNFNADIEEMAHPTTYEGDPDEEDEEDSEDKED